MRGPAQGSNRPAVEPPVHVGWPPRDDRNIAASSGPTRRRETTGEFETHAVSYRAGPKMRQF